ncbi:MAG: Mfa1 family fimbria major subunit [Bacteroidia bacterium]|nr:Mfa1 family fimbria major subunit [Bacteroidia bacterium]
MKLNKLFLIGAIALGLVACNNEEEIPTPETEGKYFVSVAFTLSSPQTATRANSINPDSQEGTTDETSLANASVLVVALKSSDKSYAASQVFPISAFTGTATAGQYIPKEEAALPVAELVDYDVWVVTGPQTLLDNLKTEFDAAPAKLTGKTVTTALTITDVSALTSAQAFVMSSRSFDNTTPTPAAITAVAKAQDTKAAAVASRAKVLLDRLVAKATVKVDAAFASTNSSFTATVSGWTLEQGKPQMYTVMQDKSTANTAKPATIDDNDWNPTSPVVALMNFDTSWGNTPAAFTKVGFVGAEIKSAPCLYTTENTNTYVNNTNGSANYQLGNTTYALIQVKIQPAALYTDETNTTTVNPNTDGTFYYGLATHKFYTTAAAAEVVNGVNTDNTKAGYYTYVAGMAYYPVWIGQQQDNEAYAPVVRNHAYNLNIMSIIALNKPYDPINPANPKAPANPADPANPNDGTNNPDPTPVVPTDPIVSITKYIAAELQVMPWTAVTKDVILK